MLKAPENIESFTIPDSVTEIGAWSFDGCNSLKSINIPNGVTKIGQGAFRKCGSLESINISDSVIEIGADAFAHCRSLKSIDIPSSVIKIDDEAFMDCDNLESINIPSSVTEMGNDVFRECPNLESVNIPDGVAKIGEGVPAKTSKRHGKLTFIDVNGTEVAASAQDVITLNRIGGEADVRGRGLAQILDEPVDESAVATGDKPTGKTINKSVDCSAEADALMPDACDNEGPLFDKFNK